MTSSRSRCRSWRIESWASRFSRPESSARPSPSYAIWSTGCGSHREVGTSDGLLERYRQAGTPRVCWPQAFPPNLVDARGARLYRGLGWPALDGAVPPDQPDLAGGGTGRRTDSRVFRLECRGTPEASGHAPGAVLRVRRRAAPPRLHTREPAPPHGGAG